MRIILRPTISARVCVRAKTWAGLLAAASVVVVVSTMGHGRRLRQDFMGEETPEFGPGQVIGRVADIRGKGIVAVQLPADEGCGLRPSLAHLPPRFRNVLFLRRGTRHAPRRRHY